MARSPVTLLPGLFLCRLSNSGQSPTSAWASCRWRSSYLAGQTSAHSAPRWITTVETWPASARDLGPIDGSVDCRLLVDVRPVGRAGRADPPFAVVAVTDGQLFARHLVHRNPPCFSVSRGVRLGDLGARRLGFLLKHGGDFVDGNVRLGVFMHQAPGRLVGVQRLRPLRGGEVSKVYSKTKNGHHSRLLYPGNKTGDATSLFPAAHRAADHRPSARGWNTSGFRRRPINERSAASKWRRCTFARERACGAGLQ